MIGRFSLSPEKDPAEVARAPGSDASWTSVGYVLVMLNWEKTWGTPRTARVHGYCMLEMRGLSGLPCKGH